VATQFILAPPQSTSSNRTANLIGRSAAAAAILWNCHIAITGPGKFLNALTTVFRVPPERPMIIPGTRYEGVLVRLATRTHRIADEITRQTRPRRDPRQGTCQKMYVEAFNEYLSRHQNRQNRTS
jgi:hypothetical protein